MLCRRLQRFLSVASVLDLSGLFQSEPVPPRARGTCLGEIPLSDVVAACSEWLEDACALF
jgi:hypothetical protein